MGKHFWAVGYFIGILGIDQDTRRQYLKYQAKEENSVEENQQKFDF